MTPYAQLPTNNPKEFMRTVGLSQEDFQHLTEKLADYLDEQKALNPQRVVLSQDLCTYRKGVGQSRKAA